MTIHRVRCSGTSHPYRVRCSEHFTRKPVTCENIQQGPEGPIIRKVSSRTRVTRAGGKKFWTNGPSGPCHTSTALQGGAA